ncbi:DUF1275 family protein, partial [Staphylococcus pasteuri_A]|nr:DUF1275 domain-containing protein [Staphylococcus pasteuri_A]
VLLKFVGGYIYAYTFKTRGGKLAAGQTGNIKCLASELTHSDLNGGMFKNTSDISVIVGDKFVSLINHQMSTRYCR